MPKSEALRRNISEQLKEARIEAGLSVTEAAEALGKSKNTIYSWEMGRILPTADVLLQVMVLYGIKDFNIFLKGIESEETVIAVQSKKSSRSSDLTEEQIEILTLMDEANELGRSAARAVLETFRKKDGLSNQ